MTDRIIDILQLPEDCLVNKRITKAFFKRNFDLITAEKTLLDDPSSISSVDLIASISPGNANVPAWQDAETTFEEVLIVSVLTTTEGLDKLSGRIIDLIQKYIPYHILLIVHDGERCIYNAALKRINQNENGKRIVDKKFTTEIICMDTTTKNQNDFLVSVGFQRMATPNLKALYEGYIQSIVGINAAPVTGKFELRPAVRTRGDVETLEQIAFLEKEISALSNKAQKETQIRNKIELNSLIQQKRQQVETLKNLIIEA